MVRQSKIAKTKGESQDISGTLNYTFLFCLELENYLKVDTTIL